MEEVWSYLRHQRPECSYLLTMQVGAILRVINDIRTRARIVVSPDILFDWEYNLEHSEKLGFNLRCFPQRINIIKDSHEKNIPLSSDVVMEKEAKIAKLTEQVELEKVALQVLKDGKEQKSYFFDFL